MQSANKQNNSIAYISTYPPRECGIATFTQDLTSAIDTLYSPKTKSKIVAINEKTINQYHYPKQVWKSITASSKKDYSTLAERINKKRDIKLVSIQHEFGLFGGDWGDFLIPFLDKLKKPVAVTFHTVLPSPNGHLKHVVKSISKKANAIIIMNERSGKILEREYDVPKSVIWNIPHGIPSTPFEKSHDYKKNLGLNGRFVLSTFGLLSKDKGVEYAIYALPKIVKKFPNVLYLILGITHPVVRRHEGEKYRNFLESEIDRLELKNHVRFYNTYLTVEEILLYLKATDIYLCSALDPKQSVSGTLSYALGCGRCVIATPSEYAKQIINNENGMLVQFKNSSSITKALNTLMSNEKLMRSQHKNAYEFSRHMTWPNVASAYHKMYETHAKISTNEIKLPSIKLDYLWKLTDDFGILHHARFSTPVRRFGYSFDDNARALVVCGHYFHLFADKKILEFIRLYLHFIKFTQRPSGTFANIVSATKSKERHTDEDVQGRGIWALGYVSAIDTLPKNILNAADTMFHKSLQSLENMKSPRAIAFGMTGLYYYLKKKSDKHVRVMFTKLANRQMALYKKNATTDWPWFEDSLTYSNSKISESLYYAYEITGNKKYLQVANASLQFLSSVTYEEKHYSPIGQNGWYEKNKKRAYFDQQPEDVASMVQTKLLAYNVTKQSKHIKDAHKAFQWFLGRNHINQIVYDEVTGGCRDGLSENSLNLNQGAESTLSYLLARLDFEDDSIKRYFNS